MSSTLYAVALAASLFAFPTTASAVPKSTTTLELELEHQSPTGITRNAKVLLSMPLEDGRSYTVVPVHIDETIAVCEIEARERQVGGQPRLQLEFRCAKTPYLLEKERPEITFEFRGDLALRRGTMDLAHTKSADGSGVSLTLRSK